MTMPGISSGSSPHKVVERALDNWGPRQPRGSNFGAYYTNRINYHLERLGRGGLIREVMEPAQDAAGAPSAPPRPAGTRPMDRFTELPPLWGTPCRGAQIQP